MKTLTSIHEAMHCVAAAVAIAKLPGASGAMIEAYINLENRDPCGPGEVRFRLSERLRINAEYVDAFAACGPLGFYLGAADIGRSIESGRQSEVMSPHDCELARELTVMDTFIAGAACHLWKVHLGKRSLQLHAALTDWRARFHAPMPIPVSAFISDKLARKFRAEAERRMPLYLPARATFKRPDIAASFQ